MAQKSSYLPPSAKRRSSGAHDARGAQSATPQTPHGLGAPRPAASSDHRNTGERRAELAADRRANAALESQPARHDLGPTRVQATPDLPGLGGGRPLDAATQLEMETRFNADFSQVRVHTDAAAAREADVFDSEAFAVQGHIVFGPGASQLSGPAQRRLLAHELGHLLEENEGAAAPVRSQKKPQPLIQGLKPVYFAKVKQLLISKPGIDADTVALARSLNLTSTAPQKIKSAVIGGQDVDFMLSLRWLSRKGSRTTEGSAVGATRTFDISIGYDFSASPPPKQHPYWNLKSKDPVDSNAYLMAEVLHHELLHLQIQIDKAIAAANPQASFSEAFRQYVVTRSYLQDVQAPKFAYLDGDKVAAAAAAIKTLIPQMCRDLPSGYSVSEANQTKLVNNALGFFVQEKFAFWKTAGVFGPAEDNALIAHSYVRNYFAGVLGPDLETGGRVFDNFETTRRSPNGFFGDLAQDLISRVEFLFKYLDDALLRPGESRPR